MHVIIPCRLDRLALVPHHFSYNHLSCHVIVCTVIYHAISSYVRPLVSLSCYPLTYVEPRLSPPVMQRIAPANIFAYLAKTSADYKFLTWCSFHSIQVELEISFRALRHEYNFIIIWEHKNSMNVEILLDHTSPTKIKLWFTKSLDTLFVFSFSFLLP